ncbi:MAG: cation transporter [Euryarchaeota archaeon]|nr:cation transporter [Euryarchaeota archaeon]
MLDGRLRASLITITIIIFMIVLKLGIGVTTNSISIISQAVDSMTDLASSILALYAIGISTRPADEKHPYGHSKIENLISVFVGSSMIFAAALVAQEAIVHIIRNEGPIMLELGIGVMAIAVLVNLIVSTYLYRISRLERSMALEASATQLRTDVISNSGVLVGLAAIYFTGLIILDSISALLMTIYIVVMAVKLIIKSSADLLDESILPEEERAVREVLARHSQYYSYFHALKTRRGGRKNYLELHLAIKKDMRIDYAHELAEHLSSEIAKELPHLYVNIHLEPEK